MIRDQELAGLAMTLSHDAKIKITVSGDGSFCNKDGSHINIARMPSTPLGRMLMTGLVFHEIGHKNHTKGGRPDGLLGDMMNVIEDIRVDIETIKDRPGTCFNLEAVTTHYVNKGSLEPKNLPHALLGKVMAYGFGHLMGHKSILQLEDLCNEMMDDAFGEEFITDVETVIKGIPKLRSTKDATVMAEKLVDLLIDQQQPPPPPQSSSPSPPAPSNQSQESCSSCSSTSPPMEPPPQHEDSDGPTGAGSKGDTDSAEPSAPGQSEQSGQAGNQQQDSSTPKDDGQQQSNEPQTDDEGTGKAAAGGNGAGSGGGKRPTPEEIAEMLRNKTGYGDLSALIQSELDSMADNVPSDILNGIPLLPVVGRMKARNGRLDEVEAISASSRIRARLLGLLQSIKRCPKSYGMSGRKLAHGRLPKLAVGDPRIFKKKVESVEVNTAVTVLLDLSGSMSSMYELANSAAFALHNTLFGLKGVAVCSMEFSGKDQDPEVNVLVDFGSRPLSENFNHYPFDGTPTHNAIWAARAMLLQRREPRKIMLILTDGCPDDGSETKAATRRTMKDGIEIAAIGIINQSVRNYWDNHKVIDTIQELPSAMFSVMECLLTTRNRRCAS